MKTYLFITKNWAPSICGVSDYTYFLAKELQKAGHKVHIMTKSQEKLERTEFEMNPVIKKLSVFKIFKLMDHVKKIDPDVINLQYLPQMTDRFGISPSVALFTLLVRLFLRQKLVVTMHELFIPFERPILWPIAMIQRLYFFIVAFCAHKVIVTTAKRRDYLNKFFASKTRLIPVGSNVPVIQTNDGERSSLKRKYKGEEKQLLISFGTASRGKDYIFLLDMVREMNANSYPSKLLLVGDIERDEKVLRAIKEKIYKDGLQGQVELTGKVSDEEISKLFSISDLFIVKQKDGISTGSGTVIGAMAHRLPIVTNEEQGIDETFRKNLTLVDMSDPKKAAIDTIKTLKTGNMDEMRIHSYNTYEKYFTWGSIAKEFLGLDD